MKRICNIALAIILLCGCDSFLDVTPKGKLLPEKVQDFDEMIGDSRNPSSINPLAEMCGDNLYMTEERLTGKMMSEQGKAYRKNFIFRKRTMRHGTVPTRLFTRAIWYYRKLPKQRRDQMLIEHE